VFTEVKRLRIKKPTEKIPKARRGLLPGRVLIRLLEEYYINKYLTGLKLEIANALDLKYD
jgi:hypothetical protein